MGGASDRSAAPAGGSAEGGPNRDPQDAPADEVRLDAFKSSCLRKFDRIGITNMFRPAEGLKVAIRMELERLDLDAYSIQRGFVAVDVPDGTTRVELRGGVSFQLSRSGDRIAGDVRYAEIQVLLDGRKIAEKGLWPGYEGQCPVELVRAEDGYRGFISLVMPLEVGDVEFPSAFALPCCLSLDRTRMVLGGDEPFDPRELYIRGPAQPSGGLILSADFVVGATNELRLVMGPHHGHYVLYGSDRLNDKTAEFDGCSGWNLDLPHQVVAAEGTLDEAGEATIRIDVPEDPALSGTTRWYQAVVESDNTKCSSGVADVRFVMR